MKNKSKIRALSFIMALLLTCGILSSCAAPESSSVNKDERTVSSEAEDTSSMADISEEREEDQAKNESSEEELTEDPILGVEEEPIDSELAEELGLTEEEDENEESFEDGEAFEDSENAKFLCEKNGFSADNLLPETDGSIRLNGVITYDTCYYLNYSGNDGADAFSICVSSDKFDSLEELCESFNLSDGSFSLPVKATLNEEAQAVITVTEVYDSDINETAVYKLTKQGFMYTIFASEGSAETLLGYAEKIDL